MAKFKEYDQKQTMLIVLDNKVNFPDGSLVRFINDFIEKYIDISVFEKKRNNDFAGAPANHAKMLLKIIFYGFTMGVYSIRYICEKLLPRHIDFLYLSAHQTVNHSTVSRFINLYKQEIEDIFTIILYIANEMGYVNDHLIAIDGTKIKANASRAFNGNYETFLKKKEVYNTMLDNLFEKVKRLENSKNNDIEYDEKQMENDERLETRYQNGIDKIDTFIKMYEEGKLEKTEKVNLIDPDSGSMKTGKNAIQGYNCQVAVNNNGIILETAVGNVCSDRNESIPMVKKTVEMLKILNVSKKDISNKCFLMDKGYSDAASIGELIREGYRIYIPSYNGGDIESSEVIKGYHCTLAKKGDKFILKCPGDQKMEGKQMGSDPEKMKYKFKADRNKCAACQYADKCIKKIKTPKSFTVEKAVCENIKELNELKKLLQDKNELDIYHKRMGTVEPIFGTIKQHRNFKQFLVRGINKVQLQWKMVCSAINLRHLWVLNNS